MGAINHAFNQAGWSILHLANAASKYRSKLNEEGQNRAKQSYSTAATIKKQNNELTKNISELPRRFFDDNSSLPPERDEQKIAEQKVLGKMAQEKTKPTSFSEITTVNSEMDEQKVLGKMTQAKTKPTSFGEITTVNSEMDEQKIAEQKVLEKMAEEKTKPTSFSELPTVSAERSETNISAKDPEVQGLIEVKQKNALRAAAGQRSQERYQNIKERLTYRFADEHNIDDVWRNISLDPNLTDEMIKKAGYTKTKILEEWKWYTDSPTDWIERLNTMGDEYGIAGGIAEAEEGSNFGRLLSAYIKAKAGGKTLKQQQEEYELSKAEKEPEEANYKVWQDDSTEEEKDEVKTDRNFTGIMF